MMVPQKGVGVLLHAPTLAEVVLAPGAVHAGRPGVVVDEDHVVALAPPGALVVEHRVVAADEGARAGRLEDGVALAREVGDLCLEAVGLHAIRGPAVHGVLAPPVGVEVENRIRIEGGGEQLVIDVEVLEVGVLALVSISMRARLLNGMVR